MACQQGHFWSFILPIPTQMYFFWAAKQTCIFCPLARVRQLVSFLLIQLWTPTLGMCAQRFHVPSVCYSTRWFVKAPLPGLFSTSLDSISSTFHHLSSVSTSNTHFSFLYSALLAGVFAGSWPSSHGGFIAPMGVPATSRLLPLPLSNVYSIQFCNLFRTF